MNVVSPDIKIESENSPLLGYIKGTNQPVALDDTPSVSFDIRLGAKYEHVDFDYDSYRELVTKMAEGDQVVDLGGLSIVIRESMGKTKGGSFNPVGQEIEIAASKPSRKKSAARLSTSNLIHETQHAVDFSRFNEKDSKNFGEKAALKANLSYIVNKVGMYTYYPSAISEFITQRGTTGMVAGGALMLSGTAGHYMFYHRSVREVRARQAEKNHEHYEEIVALTPRVDSTKN